MIYFIPLVFLLWPFKLLYFNSQIIGLLIIFLNFFLRKEGSFVPRVNIPLFALLNFFIFLFLCFLSIISSKEESEILKYMFHVLMIPFLYYFSKLYITYLGKYSVQEKSLRIFYLTAPFVLFCGLQILFPSFKDFINPYITSNAAKYVVENNFQGHNLRDIGWNGFLFSSYAVALALTALGLLFFNEKPGILSLIFEYSCLFLALIAGRSSIPLILIYIFFVFIKFNKYRILTIIVTFFIAIFWVLNRYGIDFFIWLLEPLYRYFEEGSFYSGSVNETGSQFAVFFGSENIFDVFLGKGIYFSNNNDYEYLGYFSGDSGIIRVYHVVGFFGLIAFLFMWFSFFVRILSSFAIKSRNNTWQKFYAFIFISYGIVFFLKSEWLYQNFFVFMFFYFYHLSFEKVNDEKSFNSRYYISN